MSEHDVELTRRFIAAWNTRDVEAIIAYCGESLEFQSRWVDEVYHGHDGFRTFHRDMKDAWGDEIRIEPDAYFDLGEQVLSFYVIHARGEHSVVEVAMPVTGVARWRDGLLAYWKSYTHREDALRDLGVSEDELEPIAP